LIFYCEAESIAAGWGSKDVQYEDSAVPGHEFGLKSNAPNTCAVMTFLQTL